MKKTNRTIFKNITAGGLLILALLQTGCSQHKKEILLGGLVGAAAGAGLGYAVVHHGDRRQHEVQNTIITSAIFAVGTMGALALHYHLMDQQKVDIMSNLTSKWMEDPSNQNKVMKLGEGTEMQIQDSQQGRLALELDDNTRWVYPTFRRRQHAPDATEDQIISSRYSWEILRPGFFVSRQTQPWYFEREATMKSGAEMEDRQSPRKVEEGE